MIKLELPGAVETILNTLNQNGYQGYVVGGCVRDGIMGITPHDWDICTSALPQQIIDLFSGYRVIPTGLQHGTVTVVMDGEEFEITTYRIDGKYKDNRHPESVEFVEDLKLDLMRRDFTINAMAYNSTDGLIDYFGGQEDIKNKTIRCVGNPYERFKEDALRMIRAYRFSIRYGFEIESETKRSLFILADLLNTVSAERVNSELTKILLCDIRGKENLFYGFVLAFCVYVSEFAEIGIFKISDVANRIAQSPVQLELRLTLLFDFEIDVLEDILKRLRFSNETIKSVVAIRKYGSVIRDNYAWLNPAKRSVAQEQCYKSYYYERKLLHDIGFNLSVFATMYAKSFENDPDYILYDIFAARIKLAEVNKLTYRLSDLSVNGNDIMKIGYTGKQIGRVLNVLLDLIMKNAVDNDKEILLGVADSMKGLML